MPVEKSREWRAVWESVHLSLGMKGCSGFVAKHLDSLEHYCICERHKFTQSQTCSKTLISSALQHFVMNATAVELADW